MKKSEDLLSKVENLNKRFFKGDGLLMRNKTVIRAVNGVNLEIKDGEVLALVGESGSGKTTLGKTIIRIYKPTEGRIWFKGEEISAINGKRLRAYRKYMQMVFQDPTSSLNPRNTIFEILSLPLKTHFTMTKVQRLERAKNLLKMIDLPDDILYRYPHSLSGGQKQRVNIARAIASNPTLIVLDEPTSALDVSVQAKILSLLKKLKEELNLTYIYISHDLAVVKNIADRIAVMYLGQIVEIVSPLGLFSKPFHPYTKALLSAIPIIYDDEKKMIPEEITLEGEIPNPSMIPPGCSFYSRCRERMNICKKERPPITELEEGHHVVCFLTEMRERTSFRLP
jgi:oligopeptide/dipeptide ABC transporter ATP-binding protein